MRISDWSSDVCSSDLRQLQGNAAELLFGADLGCAQGAREIGRLDDRLGRAQEPPPAYRGAQHATRDGGAGSARQACRFSQHSGAGTARTLLRIVSQRADDARLERFLQHWDEPRRREEGTPRTETRAHTN